MNVFSLFAKLSLDAKEYEKGLSEAHSKAGSFVSGVKSVVGKAGDILATVGKAAAAAVGTASTAVSALAKKSLDAYANFEQLEGGAKLMFGDAYDFIMQKSAEAYSTVQLSQNEYLQQVNSFAVGLKTALNGNEQAAAELADRIITAEADIVSATGNSQEAVQNAFNGIMKSNYTMLDNLQLGIKPTQEGMQEVINKVNAWNAAQGKATQYTMENLADVQSALVDYVEMQGLAGYASNEASTTIQGSIAGMKAAWQNFLTGTGTPAQLVKSMNTAAGNVVKQIKVIVPQLTEGLKGLAQELVPEIPPIIEDTLPIIIDSASTLITGLADQLPSLISTLTPSLVSGVTSVVTALVTNLPSILKSIGQAIPIIIDELKSHSGELLSAAGEIFGYLATGLVDNSRNIGEKAVDIITSLGESLTSEDVLGNLVSTAVDIINGLFDGLTSQGSMDKIVERAPTILSNIVGAIGNATTGLLDAVGKIITNLFDYFSKPENQEKIKEGAKQVMIAIGQALENVVNKLEEYIGKIATYIKDELVALFDGEKTAGEILDELGAGFLKVLGTGWKIMNPFAGLLVTGVQAFNEQEEENAANEQYLSDPWAEGMTPEQYEEHLKEYEKRKTESGYKPPQNSGIMNEGIWGTEDFRGGSYDQAAAAREYYWRTGAKGIPVFGKGGIVTKPTVALIGEDGAEAVVPLEKDSDVGRRFGGSTYNVTVNMTVNASNMGDIENAGNDMIRIIDTRLRQYQLQQVRGQGGTAW